MTIEQIWEYYMERENLKAWAEEEEIRQLRIVFFAGATGIVAVMKNAFQLGDPNITPRMRLNTLEVEIEKFQMDGPNEPSKSH